MANESAEILKILSKLRFIDFSLDRGKILTFSRILISRSDEILLLTLKTVLFILNFLVVQLFSQRETLQVDLFLSSSKISNTWYPSFFFSRSSLFNPLQSRAAFLYPLKTSENL